MFRIPWLSPFIEFGHDSGSPSTSRTVLASIFCLLDGRVAASRRYFARTVGRETRTLGHNTLKPSWGSLARDPIYLRGPISASVSGARREKSGRRLSPPFAAV